MIRNNTIIRSLNGTPTSSVVTLTRQTYGGAGSSADCLLDAMIVDKLKRLKNTIEITLKKYIGYLNGDLSELPKSFNNEEIVKLSSTFFNMRVPSLTSTIYEYYRIFAITLIPTFSNITNKILKCQETEGELQAALEKASILDDTLKLQQYINGLKNRMYVIPQQTITIPMATIKEPYNTYIKLYGFPENMLWDPDKLGYIVNLLKLKV